MSNFASAARLCVTTGATIFVAAGLLAPPLGAGPVTTDDLLMPRTTTPIG